MQRRNFVSDPLVRRIRRPDCLNVKDNEGPPLDCLATLVAKEYAVYNNPRASTDEVVEEVVLLLVRRRRQLPVRRR